MKFRTRRGLELYYEVLGEGEPTVVLLHGRTSNHTTFRPQREALSARCRLVLTDLSGHGESDAPRPREAYSMTGWVEDLRELSEGLDLPPFVLLGHSMGGFVALRFALAHGEVLRGLVLEDTGPGRLPGDPPPDRREPSPADTELRLAQEQGMAAIVELYGGDALDSGKRDRLLAHKPWSFAHAIRVCRETPSVADRLGDIAMPTLILCGERDTGFLKASRFMESAIPDARLLVFPQAGHSPHREARDAYNESLLAFLGALVPGEANQAGESPAQ